MKQAYTARILLAEDDRVDQIAVERELDRLGVPSGTMATVNNGLEALEYFENASEMGMLPSLMILDLRMPKMDGVQLLKAIRVHELERVRNLPVVVVSASNLKHDRSVTAQLGVNAYFNKRDEFGEFLTVLGRWLVGDRMFGHPKVESSI